MRYLGGKNRTAKRISVFLEGLRAEGQTYFDPFVGGAWVLQEMTGERIASDACRPLISLYRSILDGWVPPDSITEDDYAYWKSSPEEDNPMKAFVGFGCSHSGKFFGGFARSADRNYCLNAKNSLLKQFKKLKGVKFIDGSFESHTPEGMLIYCDPPYAGTTSYGYFDSFDHELFWMTMRRWSDNNTVVISEYQAPSDFTCVLEIPVKTDMHGEGRKGRVEKLFMQQKIDDL